MMKFQFSGFVLLLIWLSSCSPSQPTVSIKHTENQAKMNENLIESILKKYPEQFDSLLRNNGEYRIQILYTQVDRQKNNRPVFTVHRFNINPDLYFYPASTVKMPV